MSIGYWWRWLFARPPTSREWIVELSKPSSRIITMEREPMTPRPKPQAARSEESPYEPTLAELEKALRIDTLDLIRSDAEQPELFYRVAKLLAALRADQDYVKQQLSEAEAHASIKVRQDEAGALEADPKAKKMTVGEAEALVKIDPSVVVLNTKLLKISRHIGVVHALREAYQQRKSSLSDLVELQRQAGTPVDPAVAKRAVNEQRQDFRYQFGRDNHGE